MSKTIQTQITNISAKQSKFDNSDLNLQQSPSNLKHAHNTDFENRTKDSKFNTQFPMY